MSAVSKLYSSIIRNRLDKVVEDNQLLGEMQNGFRKGRSTLDNELILRHVIEKARATKKNCYLSFIDLRKAYDRVWVQGFWKCLEKLGFGGKTLDMIKALYENTQQRVCLSWGNTKWFQSDIGLKQGCVLSPLLFALYLKTSGEKLINAGVGIQFMNQKMPALFFADDMVLMTNKSENMNKLLRVLSGMLSKIKMEINCKKSQMLIIKGTKGEMLIWILFKLPIGAAGPEGKLQTESR